MSEFQESQALWEWCQLNSSAIPELGLMFHIPNEGKRSAITGARLITIGMVRGVFDYFWGFHYSTFHGVFIEIKTQKGRPTEEQLEFKRKWEKFDYECLICYGWKNAAAFMVNRLKHKYPLIALKPLAKQLI